MPMTLDVRNLLRTRRTERVDGLHDLARRLAKNESIDEEVIASTIERAGVDADELLALVAMVERRNALRAVGASVPGIEKEVKSLDGSINLARAALEEAEQRYRRAVSPLFKQKEAAETRLATARAAASELLWSDNLPAELIERIESAREALHQAEVAHRKVEADAQRQRDRVAAGEAMLDSEGGEARWAARWEDEVERKHVPERIEAAIRNINGGRYQLQEMEPRLAESAAAVEAAQAAFDLAEKAARDF